MGFFKDLRSDLSQAVNELLPESEIADDNTDEQINDEQINNEQMNIEINPTDNEEVIGEADNSSESVPNEDEIETKAAEATIQDELNEETIDEMMIFNLDEECAEEEIDIDYDKDDELTNIKHDETDEQMVNTLEDDVDMSSENEKMKEVLQEFTQDDNSTDNYPYDDNKSDDSQTEDIQIDNIQTDDIQPDPDDSQIGDIKPDDSQTNDIQSDDILSSDNQLKDDTYVLKVDISNEIKEDGYEDMDENIDLELLNTLNTEEEDEAEDITNQQESDLEPILKATSIADDEVTIITKGTTVNGSISTDSSLEVNGTVNGDIECLGKLSITGKVVGNSTASEVYVNTERHEGGITSEGSVKIGLGTVVLGDVIGTSGVIAGAVKGEIDIKGPVVVDSTAIINGNIKAKSVQINNGAIIEGFCSLSYSEVDIDNIFE